MLCTKIHIYDQFPVEWYAYIPKFMCRSASKLSLKILLCRTVVNYLVKLKLKLGTVRSYPTTFLWSYSFYLWNLAPENAHRAQHFKSCCFLGQPNKKLRPRFICVRRRTTSSFQPFLLPTDKFRKSKRWGLVRLSGEHWAQSQFQKLPQNSASSEIKEQARQTSLGGLISSLGEQRRQPARCSSWYQTSGHPTNPGISTVL